MQPDNACVFCASRAANSREHILPKWIRKLDPPVIKPGMGKRRYTVAVKPMLEFGAAVTSLREMKSKPLHPYFATVGVCEPCNTGWMSKLETKAIPLLTPLIKGQSPAMGAEDRTTIAAWACKTAIAFEQDDPESARFTSAQIRDVVSGKPSRAVRVSMARAAAPEPTLCHSTSGVYSSAVKIGDISVTAISAGHVSLLVHCVSPVALSPYLFGHVPEQDSRWLGVWPIESDEPLSMDGRGSVPINEVKDLTELLHDRATHSSDGI